MSDAVSYTKFEYWLSLEEKIDRQSKEIQQLKKMIKEILKINRMQMRR